jgi:glycosyltransferase involved in cell wall biosynthesis
LPRFSVIITSFNQRDFIRDAVESALALRNHDREIIVVEDGSADGSAGLLQEYGDRIRLLALSANHGKGGARNAGAAIAVGAYLVFLDGDDAFLPWALDVYERVVALKAPALLVSSMLWFSGRLPAPHEEPPRTISMVVYEDYLKKDRPVGISASSLVIERRAFEKAKGWAPDLPVMQDQDMVLRLGDATPTVLVLAPPATYHRSHPAQTVWNVAPFLDVLHEIIRRARAGWYAGGPGRRRDRAALLGGLVFFWTRRAFRAGLYWKGLMILARQWPMAAGAAIRRARVMLAGRRPVETARLHPP